MSAPANPVKKRDPRMGLRMSASLATVFTILGHTVFGFEQSVAQLFVCLLAGYSSAFFFEWVDAKANSDVPGYMGGGWKKMLDWLLSAHMTSITLSFLLYFNKRLWIAALTVVLAIGSKYLLRVNVNGRLQHFMNPSNFGITFVLATYHWVGILPWAFTVKLHGAWDYLVPLIIVMLGMRLNLLFTGRLPVIAAWLVTFFLQAAFRSWRMDTPFIGQIVVLSGIALVLFTLYMITDPQTSPSKLRSQIIFGAGIGIAYSVLLDLHIQYTIFYSVTVVCAIRGIVLYVAGKRQAAEQPKVAAAAAGAMAERAPAPVAQ
jgi:hypothetical protein